MGAYFCDQSPELVDEVRAARQIEQGPGAPAERTGTPVEEAFRTLVTGLAVRYYKALAG